MLKSLFVILGVGVICAASAGDALAMSRWEKALVQRYTSHEKCNGAGAPEWGRRSMERWRAAQRAHHRY
jgi:hypothetical protein